MDPRERLIEQALAAHERASRVLLGEDLSDLFDAELTMPQLKVLVVLHRSGPMGGHQLAEHLAVSTPTVSGLVDRLVDRGMLTRSTDERDRRVRLVALSGLGEQVVTSVHEAGWRIGRELMDRMELADLQALAQGLAALARAAHSRAGLAAPGGTARGEAAPGGGARGEAAPGGGARGEAGPGGDVAG